MHRHRLVVLGVTTALLLAACSSSGPSAENAPDTETVGSSATATPTTSGISESDEASLSETEGRPAGVLAIETPTPDVVDKDGEFRCDRLGYPCSVSDMPAADRDATIDILSDLGVAIDAAETPEAGLDAAAAVLGDVDDLVELIIDREGYTGLMFRRAGQPAFYALTSAAAPYGDGIDFDDLDIDYAALAAAASPTSDTSEPQGFGSRRSAPLVEAYHPVGGPREPKRAIVIDPFSVDSVPCPPDLPAGVQCVGEDDGERIEGMTVAGIMSSHPQIDVTHIAGPEVNPDNLRDLSSYDLVHVASHGISGCAYDDKGWAVGLPGDSSLDRSTGLPPTKTVIWSDNTVNDPDACFSAIALGPTTDGEYDNVPDGMGVGNNELGDVWMATGEFFAKRIGDDTIAYLSACTSLDGQVTQQRTTGSFVGWHGYAEIEQAVTSATAFWRHMVIDGAEFDQAIAELGKSGDDSSVTLPPWTTTVVGASLAAIGDNNRARDVIKVKVDAASNGPMQLSGIPGNGKPNFFPFRQGISFVLEGVRTGSSSEVQVAVYGNGVELDSDISVDRDGKIVSSGRSWDDWKVTVQPSAIALPDDMTVALQRSGSPLELEFRALEVRAEYTADVAVVELGRPLKSNGPIPLFTELDAVVSAGGRNASLTGNDLEVRFNSAGGPVFGEMLVALESESFGIGTWTLLLDGTYDAEAGTMEGQATSISEGEIPIAPTRSDDSGNFTGTVDLEGKTVKIVISIVGQEQTYVGTVTADEG